MKLSLKFLVALVAISLCRQIPAATFNIADGDVAALIVAINTSNANGEDDTIELATNGTYTLTEVNNVNIGDNGLPVILSDGAPGHTLLIHGNSATLQRDTAGGTPQFRIFQIGPDADVTIDGLTITNGTLVGSGGGIYNDHATLTVSNCTLSDNFVSNTSGGSGFGGGIYNDHAMLTVTNSIISDNVANGLGGGIYNDGEQGSATLAVTNSTLTGNLAVTGSGIYNDGEQGSATLTVTNSTFTSNSAASAAGGILNDGEAGGSATLTVTNSTISGNSASGGDGIGGGILNDGTSGGSATLTVTSSTLSDNSATVAGGGIYNDGESGGSATLEIGDTILNAGASGENIYNYAGTVTSHGYNISSDGGVTNDGSGTGDLTATGDQISTDPTLGPLANNGGPTLTHALLPGSPAIDAGDPNFMPPPDYDQRGPGFLRVANGRIDIGAFEVQNQSYTAQIQQPINPDESSVFNVHRGVVPVKFTLTLGGAATCDLPPATISLTRTAGGTTGEIDEAVYSGPADTGSNFRIAGCQYVYNLSSSALGPGTYRVDITINAQVVDSATFQLR